MTPEDPLQGLHPLREPPPVGWWPPAPGWWILAALLLGLVIALATWFWRRHRRNRYRRQAAAALRKLHGSAVTDSERIQQANAILKRAALAAYPDASVAALGGSDWIRFLQRTLPDRRRAFADIDGDMLYAPDPSGDESTAFTQAAMTWVQHHRRATGDA